MPVSNPPQRKSSWDWPKTDNPGEMFDGMKYDPTKPGTPYSDLSDQQSAMVRALRDRVRKRKSGVSPDKP